MQTKEFCFFKKSGVLEGLPFNTVVNVLEERALI